MSLGGWSATGRSLCSLCRNFLAIRFLTLGSDGFRKVVLPGHKHGLPASITSFVGHPSASSRYSGMNGPCLRDPGWSCLIASE